MVLIIIEFISRSLQKWKAFSTWLQKYDAQLCKKNLKKKTLQNKRTVLSVIDSQLGKKPLCMVTPADLRQFLDSYISTGRHCAAKHAYVLLKDIFREAVFHRIISTDPMQAIKPPATPVKRARILLDEYKKILKEAKRWGKRSYIYHALLLALVTGQRRGDISKMRRSDISGDYLHIKQEKTGAMIALPLDLACTAIGMSLRDVIKGCPGQDFLLSARQVMPSSISTSFAAVRRRAYDDERWEVPPSFHEIRSLSERLYRDQGIDTQRLLGHKSPQMTARYDDARGHEYQRLML